MIDYNLTEETLGYSTSPDPSNADKRLLIAGSKNVLIDYQRKVKSRPGFTRLGAGSTAATPIRNGFTWYASNENNATSERPLRFYDDEWEVYLGTVDGTAVNAWTRFKDSMSTTEIPRGATWFDTGENIDLMLLVQGDANIYEWNGAVAVVDSITGTTITKKGTATYAQSRFYTTRNKTVVCVRTGTEYIYTGGESTTTLTGISDTTGLVAGDILVQKVVTASNKPASSHTNDTIFAFENQICIGSFDDDEVWISQNDDYDDFTYSSPRLAGEGGLLTLDGPSKGFGSIGTFLLAFAGRNSVFRADYQQITVSTTLAETLRVKRLNTGVDQGALNPDCIVPIGNALAYLSNEVALRIISNPEDIGGLDPKTFSNPIKPDFDDETWTNAKMGWFKNGIYVTANSHMYILQFVEDADGKVRRFWQAPQVLSVDALSIIGDALHGHSNSVPETYELFTGASDLVANGTAGTTADKIAINAKAAYAYQTYGKRANLKNFDEYFVEGETGGATTDLSVTILYDYDGSTMSLEKTIDGTDEDILTGEVGQNSLGQNSLAQHPLGSLLNAPADARRFRVVFEVPREDFHELGVVFETNEIDRYWAIVAHGANVQQSTRRDTSIYK